MRKLFKLLAVCLAGLLTLTASFGCNKPADGAEKIDETKTQLYVNHYDGGVGHEWLTSSEQGRDGVEQAFEKLYADYKGENGKVGVQIIVNNHKSDGKTVFNDLKDTTEEIFFTSQSKYFDMVSSEYLLDISSVYTDVNTDSKTIESKMTEEQKAYYKVGGKYYALPNYETFSGINYNVNIFDKEEFFFEKGGAPSEYCAFVQNNNDDACEGSFTAYSFTGLDGELSAGPDGIYGTYDDGQAATYEEFFKLCDVMVGQGVVPFIWSGGMAGSYLESFMNALRASYEGREQLRLAYDFDGWEGFTPVAKHLVKFNDKNEVLFNADGTVQLREPVAISNENGWEMYSSAGYYYGADFLHRILSKSDYCSSNATNAHSHTDAQIDFVLSEFDTRYSKDKKQIAMFIEGSYWENEARDFGAFNKLSDYKKTANDVAYGRMAFPKVSVSEIGKKNTIAESQQNIAFISKNIPANKIELAKEFLKFCYTEANLSEFTAVTGVTRSMDFEMPADKTARLTPFGKSFLEVYKNSDVVYTVSDNLIYKVGQNNFTSGSFGTDSYQWGARQMLDEGTSAADILKGIMRKNSKSAWESSYKNYFN